MKVALVVKPSVASGHRFRRELTELELGLPSAQVCILQSQYAGHAIELAREAAADVDCLVAAGGDGTLNEVANGCLQALSRGECSAAPVIAALAYGTANDFLRATGLCIAPRARLSDGLLSCTLVGDVGIGTIVRNLQRLKRGIAIEHPRVSYRDARCVDIDTGVAPVPVEADGEFLGYTPATIDLLPGKLRFLMPV
jgi:diacylglycerol kinase family enzyme